MKPEIRVTPEAHDALMAMAEDLLWIPAPAGLHWVPCSSCDNLVACMEGLTITACSECCGTAEVRADVEVQLGAAGGPRIVYGTNARYTDLARACPPGWEVEPITKHLKIGTGRRAAPLRRMLGEAGAATRRMEASKPEGESI